MIRGSSPVVGGISIYYYAGIINKSEINQMKKLLFRATKGKVLCKVVDDQVIQYDNVSSRKVEKCVYVLVFQDVNVLRQRTQRICDSFSPDGRNFSLPKNGQGSQQDYRDEIIKLNKSIQNIQMIISTTK